MTEVVERLNDLLQLDYDAIKAYDQAIEHSDDLDAREDLEDFRLDHERHITDLGTVIVDLGGVPESEGRDLKGVLIEGLTALRSVTGTLGALRAMRMNEKLTNRTYEKALEHSLPLAVREVVRQNLQDERRHLAGIRAHIERISGEVDDSDLEEDDVEDLDDDKPTISA
jgi:rubrerythrin